MNMNHQMAIATTLTVSILFLEGWGHKIQGMEAIDIPRDFLAIQNSSRDFFREGREKLEQEVQGLNQEDFALEDLLMISDNLLLENEQWLWNKPNSFDEFLNFEGVH